jgi:hypothetical protein
MKGTGVQQHIAPMLQHADTRCKATLVPRPRELWHAQRTDPIAGRARRAQYRSVLNDYAFALASISTLLGERETEADHARQSLDIGRIV